MKLKLGLGMFLSSAGILVIVFSTKTYILIIGIILLLIGAYLEWGKK